MPNVKVRVGFAAETENLIAFAKEEGWEQEEMQFLQGFLKEFGIGEAT